MKKMSKMAKMMEMMAGKKKMKMKKGGVSSKQMDMLKTMAKKATAAQKMQLAKAKKGLSVKNVNKPADKLLLKTAAMGIEMDMVEARMGKSMDYMMKGGMMKGKMPKRGMRAAGAMKRKKAKKK